jgi:protein SCO1/2
MRAGILVAALTAFGCAKRYPVEGMVLAVQPREVAFVASHRAIPGYMPAMTMPFRVRDARELDGLRPGTRVSFRLVVRKDRSYARDLRVQAAAAFEGLGEDGARIRLPETPGKLAPGDQVPDFELLDQSGGLTRFSDFAGKVVLVQFLYTRCPLPEVCPRLAAGFASIRHRFRERMGRDLAMISITLDPRHDTPEVLSRYAKSLGADPAYWRMLTGDSKSVEAVAGRFGLVYWAEEGMIVHTSTTAVIDRDGRVAALVEGSSFRLEQFADLVRYTLERGN